MRKIALWEAKHPKTVIIAALLLLIPAFLGFIGTKVNYDILSYLPDELESVQGEQVLDKTFNTAGISIVITENMQPKQTLALKNEILTVDGVSSVIWVDTIADIGIPADILPDVLKNIFYSADGSQTMMLVRYDNTGSDDSQLKAIAQIKTLLGKNQFLSGLTVVVVDTREIAETQAPLYCRCGHSRAHCHERSYGVVVPAAYHPVLARTCGHIQYGNEHFPRADIVHNPVRRRGFAAWRHDGLFNFPH